MTVGRKNLFDPANQHDWTSLVRPPAGYRLDAALGTTFSLDFTATTALLLALLDQRSEAQAWEGHARLLRAVTLLDERVRIVVNRGQIHGDLRPSNRLFAVLDRIAIDLRLEGASFHPKVWVFKYTPRRPLDVERTDPKDSNDKNNSRAIYRIVCASRNLTVASTWEAMARLDGCEATESGKKPTDLGRELAAFFRRTLAGDSRLPGPIGALLDELPRVGFFMPGGSPLKSCEFYWQWPHGPSLLSAVRPRGRTALVVSPFVRASALKALRSRFGRLIVISRQDELDACWETSLKDVLPLEDVWVVKPEAGENTETEAEGTRSLELHAKMLLCDYGGRSANRTETWLGSANASPRGWGTDPHAMNCEAMLRFSPGVGPEAFLDQFAFRPALAEHPEMRVPNGWIEQYHPRPVEPETLEERADNLLNAARNAVAALPLTLSIQRLADLVALVLTTSDPAAVTSLSSSHPDVHFLVTPLGAAESETSHSEPLVRLAEGEIRFADLSLAQAGRFLLVKLQHRPSQRAAMFVVQAELQAEPAFWSDRRTAYLQQHLSPADFRLFLRSILLDASLDTNAPSPTGQPGDGGGAASQGSILETISVEEVLYACTKDRTRIDEVDRLLHVFEGTAHVDPAFRRFWDNFRQAVRQADLGGMR